jgi:hypothetical protein
MLLLQPIAKAFELDVHVPTNSSSRHGKYRRPRDSGIPGEMFFQLGHHLIFHRLMRGLVRVAVRNIPE